ncbi:MAG: uroporphyrinogen decarboxylase family protein [Thermoproteota archaeon]
MPSKKILLKVMDLDGCGFVPSNVAISQATWHKYRERLEDVLVKHPKIFPGFKKGSVDFDDFGTHRKGNTVVDEWGCVWTFKIDGLEGQVVKHPLEDWSSLGNMRIPDVEKGIAGIHSPPQPWEEIEASVKSAKKRGDVAAVGFPHGFFFMRLYYLRGFTNFMRDVITEPPQLYELIERLTRYNLELIERVLKMGVDLVYFGDDLGLQDRMPISREKFRKLIFPSYRRMFHRIREAGARVYLHTDGHIMEVVDDLIESGVSVLNLQDRVNGLLNMKRRIKGRVCIDLDIDRQFLLPFGTAQEIDDHIRRSIVELGSEKGGLMLTAGIYPDVPPENVDALCNSIERYMDFYGGIEECET